MGSRGGGGRVQPRKFSAARRTSLTTGNTQKLSGGTQ